MNFSNGTVFRAAWIGLSIALVGCASKAPDWIDNPSAQYSAQQYLTATGEADDRETAADRALANLAEIFEVRIAETALDFSSASVSSGAEGAVTTGEQRLSRSISTEARQVVSGAKVVEYHSTEQGRIHALAILDKQAAASRFRQGILQADRKVNDLLDHANSKAHTVIAALAALEQARLEQIHREQLNANLMVVEDGRGVKSANSVAAIEDTLRQALSTLKCAVESTDPSVKMELQRAVARMGIKIDPAANLRFTGLMDTTAPEELQGWHWVRGSYELVFTDGDQVLAKKRWPVKASATSASLVGQRLRDQINQDLPQQVFGMLTTVSDQ